MTDADKDALLCGAAKTIAKMSDTIEAQQKRIAELEAGLNDVLGRWQVTHCHSAARAALDNTGKGE